MKSLPRLILYAGAVALLALQTGCQAPRSGAAASSFPSPGPGWKTSVGQLRYATPQRAVIGEAVVSRDGARNFQLDFVAGPGLPLMSLRESENLARAEGLFARGSWSGNPMRAGRLSSWMSLREAFAALDANPRAESSAGAPLRWTARSERAGTGHRVTVDYPKTHERFVFVFAK